MNQPASPESITLEPPATLDTGPSIAEPDPVAVVESYADSLMDELFDDVDRILVGDDIRQLKVEYPESATAESLVAGDEEDSSSMVPVSSDLDIQPDSALDAAPGALAAKVESPKGRQWFGKSFDRILVGAAGASLLFTGLFWLTQHQRKTERMFTTIPEAAMTPEALKADADAQFLKYLERSIEVIDEQIQSNLAAAAPPPASLSTVTVNPAHLSVANGAIPPGNSPLGSASLLSNRSISNRPNVIERVYIPVYQPPSSQTLPPLPNPLANSATDAAASGAIPNIAPASVHVLVGVLELGDRSAALFEINGNPHRFYIGENISASGWTLVSVANQEAVIRRNGEVRSVYVGQQF